MIIFFPLFPVLVAIIVLALAIVGGIQSHINTIANIVFVISIILFAIIGIMNLVSPITTTKKVLSTLCCIILGTISSLLLKSFLLELGNIEFGLLGLIEFVFVGGVGGCICLFIAVGCMYLCLLFGD